MTLIETQEKVRTLIKDTPAGLTAAQLTSKLKTERIQIVNALGKLVRMKEIQMSEKGSEKIYTFIGTAAEKKESPATTVPKSSKSKRDFSKFKFGGKDKLPKGRYVLEICKHNFPKFTLGKLNEVFKDLKMSYGVWAEVAVARKQNQNDRQRYFSREDKDNNEIIKLKSNERIAITNQWSSETMKKFLALASKAGMKIK